ncbi:MAG: thiamine pyrophosphate-binding protein, partial [Bauldia sp.]
MTPRTGGQILAAALLRNGIERIFCVPGESYLALLDALYDTPIAVTVARQEGGAAMMAEAWGKLTGKPGIVMATRGPGATNASAGLHIGRQDSTPMILFLGQVGRSMRGREAFQEINPRTFFSEVAKSVEEVDRADRLPEAVQRAFAAATSGRPGPAVVSLPEDMLRETATVGDAAPWVQTETHPGLTQMAQLQKMLWGAARPFVILGGSRWSEAAVAGLRRFAERFDLPVSTSFRRQSLFDSDHPNYAG